MVEGDEARVRGERRDVRDVQPGAHRVDGAHVRAGDGPDHDHHVLLHHAARCETRARDVRAGSDKPDALNARGLVEVQQLLTSDRKRIFVLSGVWCLRVFVILDGHVP